MYSDFFRNKLPTNKEICRYELPSNLSLTIGRMPDSPALSMTASWDITFLGDDDAWENHSVAFLKGAIFNLAHYSCAMDLGTGEFPSLGDEMAVKPFFHGDGIFDGPCNKDMVKRFGGKKTRPKMLYIDLVTVHPQIACRNFGTIFCSEVCNLLFDFAEEMPVFTFLGAYDDTLSAKSIIRCFESIGFEKIDDSSWCASVQTMRKNRLRERDFDNLAIAVRERGRKKTISKGGTKYGSDWSSSVN